MFRNHFSSIDALVLLMVFLGCGSAIPLSAATSNRADEPNRAAIARWPLVFEPNRGQVDPAIDFIGRGKAQTVYLNSRGMSVTLAGCSFTIKMRNAQAKSIPQGMGPAGGTSNYFFGSDPARWYTGIPNYHQVHYRDLYPGIDIIYYAAPEGLEFDFRLATGADAKIIELQFEGAQKLRIEPQGLVIDADGRSILLKKPVVFQEAAAERQRVPARYVLRRENNVGIELGSYDRSKPLVIDPILSYSTYLGGSGTDMLGGMALDSDGNIYLTGNTASIDFPISNPYQSRLGGVFITKLNPAATAILYSTFLGAPRDPNADGVGPAGFGIAVDRVGNAFVIGEARQGDLPLVNALQPVFGGGLYNAFIAKLDSTGSRLLFSTYLGGSGSVGNAVALDAEGNPIMIGNAGPGFPTTPGALESYPGGGSGGFVAKLKNSGDALIYSTYLGSRAYAGASAVTVDRAGNAYVAGSVGNAGFPVTPGAFQTTIPPAPGFLFPNVCFVSKLNPTGSALVYSTLLGGGGYNNCNAIAVDAQGYAFITGMTSAADYPVTPGAFQTIFRGKIYCTGGSNCVGKSPTPNAFVTKLNPTGTALAYSTFLGGIGTVGGGDSAATIFVDAAGNAYIAGSSASNDFPMKEAIQPVRNCTSCGPWISLADAFLAKLDPDGARLLFSTYLGGSNSEFAKAIALDAGGNILVAGSTYGGYEIPFNDFPVTRNAMKTVMAGEDFTALPADVFLLHFSLLPPTEPTPSIDSAIPQVADAAANLFSLVITGKNFTPLSTVYVNGNVQASRFVSNTQIVASGLRIGGDSAARWSVSVRNMLAVGEITGISNAMIVNAPLCAIPEPTLMINLDPGFYIAEVRTQAGTPEGYWGMEVLASSGTLDGGLHFGGGLEQAGSSPAFGAFYVPSRRRVRVQLEAQPLPDGANLSIMVRLFDSEHRQIGPDYRGAASVAFEQPLDQGFYSVTIETVGDQAPPAAFLMSVLADALAGGMDVGGFLHPGLGGFGAFYLSERQQVNIRTLGLPSYGVPGASCLQLTVYDLARRRIASLP
jgi:hypothetical protein